MQPSVAHMMQRAYFDRDHPRASEVPQYDLPIFKLLGEFPKLESTGTLMGVFQVDITR